MRRARLLIGLAGLVAFETAGAHHAFTPVYDGSRTVTIEGVVSEFRLVNPHASIELDVADPDGSVVRWSVEMAGRLNLEVGGWTEDSVRPGERVTITGNPSHTGSPRLFLTRLLRADGAELEMPGAERRSALDEARRQRALERERAASQ